MTSDDDPAPAPPRLGLGSIVRADLVGTAAFTVAAVGAAALPDQLQIPYAGLSLVLFAIGIVAFVWAYLVAIGRSRYEYISTTGIFFLTGGVVDAPVRRRLMGALVVQVVAGVAAASFQLFTPVAFGTLTPMFGLGLAGLVGARFGTFEERPAPDDDPAAGTGDAGAPGPPAGR